MTPSSRAASSTREVSSRIDSEPGVRRRRAGLGAEHQDGLERRTAVCGRRRRDGRGTEWRRDGLVGRPFGLAGRFPRPALREQRLFRRTQPGPRVRTLPRFALPPSCHVLERMLTHSTSVSGPAASSARGPSSRPSRARACPRSTPPRRDLAAPRGRRREQPSCACPRRAHPRERVRHGFAPRERAKRTRAARVVPRGRGAEGPRPEPDGRGRGQGHVRAAGEAGAGREGGGRGGCRGRVGTRGGEARQGAGGVPGTRQVEWEEEGRVGWELGGQVSWV